MSCERYNLRFKKDAADPIPARFHVIYAPVGPRITAQQKANRDAAHECSTSHGAWPEKQNKFYNICIFRIVNLSKSCESLTGQLSVSGTRESTAQQEGSNTKASACLTTSWRLADVLLYVSYTVYDKCTGCNALAV